MLYTYTRLTTKGADGMNNVYNYGPSHQHKFAGVTSVNLNHSHRYSGFTDPAPSGVPHSHRYYTVTTYDDGHTHIVSGISGTSIELPEGGHYHNFGGEASISGSTPHSHSYKGTTGIS